MHLSSWPTFFTVWTEVSWFTDTFPRNFVTSESVLTLTLTAAHHTPRAVRAICKNKSCMTMSSRQSIDTRSSIYRYLCCWVEPGDWILTDVTITSHLPCFTNTFSCFWVTFTTRAKTLKQTVLSVSAFLASYNEREKVILLTIEQTFYLVPTL